MSLRTRIAVTFVALLAAVLAAALSAVSVANRGNAERAVKQQLGSNMLLLTQAAQAVAYDFAFRDAVTDHDMQTLVSLLENAGGRVHASLLVLTSYGGQVIAASGSHAAVGSQFPIEALHQLDGIGGDIPNIMVDNGKIYQVIAVPVKTPLPVAWLAMGFELDADATIGLARISRQQVSLLIRVGNSWTHAVTRDPVGASHTMGDAIIARSMAPANRDSVDEANAKHALARSFAEAQEPFEKLTRSLVLIAGASLIGFGWAAFAIARNITRPLRALTRSVEHIRAGTYDAAPTLQRGDELGVLAEGLQLMQTAIMSRDKSIRQLAYEDSLTGLMNRTAFSVKLAEILSTESATIGVAIINLNRFRRINEHLGYSVGDAVLKKTAERLASIPSISFAVARLAADQFAAFICLDNTAGLQAWGTSILVALADSVVVEAHPIDISATVGLAVSPGDALVADELLRCAELALEQARREKRALAIFLKSTNPSARDQLSLLGELRHAVDHDELRLYYQPKIELATGRIAGAEVLIRWQHPTRGLLSPDAFVPFAEQTGFMRRMTRWTLDHAIAQAAEWHRAGQSIPLAINISADDLGDMRFDARVAGLLTRHQLPPALLTLELTESGFIEDPVRALSMLDALAVLGISLSIDDFGTGYSSLSHLARMPVHEVKIDRSFIQGLESDAEYAAIVRSAVEMGHSLGLRVVAEGIETETSAHRLRSLGCDIGQGYLYAKPMPCEQLQAWLKGKSLVPIVALPIDFAVAMVTDTLSLATY